MIGSRYNECAGLSTGAAHATPTTGALRAGCYGMATVAYCTDSANGGTMNYKETDEYIGLRAIGHMDTYAAATQFRLRMTKVALGFNKPDAAQRFAEAAQDTCDKVNTWYNIAMSHLGDTHDAITEAGKPLYAARAAAQEAKELVA